MDTTRIDVLKQLLDQNPSSTFARYGLAMEYVKAGQLESAVAEFEDPSALAAAGHRFALAGTWDFNQRAIIRPSWWPASSCR